VLQSKTVCQWNTLVPLDFGDVPQFVLSYASGVQVSRVYPLKLQTRQKNCLIPERFFHKSKSQTDENQHRGQISACISALQKPSIKAACPEKGCSLVVNLERIPKRLPCLIVDSSAEGYRLMAACKLKCRQIVEIIPDEDPLKCHGDAV